MHLLLAISMLSDEKIVTGCEGDIITSISMFIFYLLSDGGVTYGDRLDFDDNKDIVMFSACGFAPSRHFALIYGDFKRRLNFLLKMLNIEKAPVDYVITQLKDEKPEITDLAISSQGLFCL